MKIAVKKLIQNLETSVETFREPPKFVYIV